MSLTSAHRNAFGHPEIYAQSFIRSVKTVLNRPGAKSVIFPGSFSLTTSGLDDFSVHDWTGAFSVSRTRHLQRSLRRLHERTEPDDFILPMRVPVRMAPIFFCSDTYFK
jgi:hypothetical protein